MGQRKQTFTHTAAYIKPSLFPIHFFFVTKPIFYLDPFKKLLILQLDSFIRKSKLYNILGLGISSGAETPHRVDPFSGYGSQLGSNLKSDCPPSPAPQANLFGTPMGGSTNSIGPDPSFKTAFFSIPAPQQATQSSTSDYVGTSGGLDTSVREPSGQSVPATTLST